MLERCADLFKFKKGIDYIDSREKKILDKSGALAGLLVLSVPLSCILLVKYFEDGEFPIFIQERIGRDGKAFNIYKIRSMKNGKESDDIRVTWLGKKIRKSHFDEVLQFVNVLKGEMSLVGVRPHTGRSFKPNHRVSLKRLVDMCCDYTDQKPGVTGIKQILTESGYHQDYKMYHPNAFYLREANLLLDIKVIFRTFDKAIKDYKEK